MFALFFVRRPVFAIVIAVITTLVGLLALTALPIAQYPEVVPPQVVITAFYPGATAETVAATVASPIEEQVNGVENMLYMESQATSDGSLRLTVTFKIGTNPDTAQVLVQNRVAIAQPKLPDVVKAIGVTTKKQSSAILLVVSLYSPPDPATGRPKLEQLEVSNYARLQVKDDLARIPGVGDVFAFGEREYSMRIWLDPDKMADNNLSAADVAAAVRTQNTQVAAGQIGQAPAPAGQQFEMVVNTQGRLTDARAFEDIVVKSGVDGTGGEQLVRIRDVGRAELGARNYDTAATLDGRPSIGLPIFQLPGANAFTTAETVREKMKQLRESPGWPAGIEYAIIFDPTTFIEASVEAVVDTLAEAIVLVAIVVLVFLQSWRAAVIPVLSGVVSLVGTLAAMYALGYSINSLTLFGMVLAIGIVVDDADRLYFGTSGPGSGDPLFAVRAGATGDITPAKGETSGEWVAWSRTKAGPSVASPVAAGGFVSVPGKRGTLSCYHAATGEPAYKDERVGALRTTTPSAVVAGGRVYLPDENGRTAVVKAGCTSAAGTSSTASGRSRTGRWFVARRTSARPSFFKSATFRRGMSPRWSPATSLMLSSRSRWSIGNGERLVPFSAASGWVPANRQPGWKPATCTTPRSPSVTSSRSASARKSL